jgi:phenylpropionate dioxygenase-like ring-hydroxylating dioxygenase large terminal subunit
VTGAEVDATAGTMRAHAPGPTYQDMLDADTHAVPLLLRVQSAENLDLSDVPAERYFSRQVHELEKQRIWARVWQLACREEAIPEVGDTEVYDIAEISILVVRVGPDEIKAYYNACLHRGRRLRSAAGRVSELRCPFHGFCWHLDGALKRVPSAWDFPHVDAEHFGLPEVRVGRWGGFVFITMDPDAASLEDFLGALPEHFERWDLENRYTEAHVEKLLPCNWKIAQESFMESFHVAATHPQVTTATADTASQYDVFGTWSRAITPRGYPSEQLRTQPTEQEMLDSMIDRSLDDPRAATLPAGGRARTFVAAGGRERLRQVIGDAADNFCDAEMVDSFYFTVFPNFHPWGAFNGLTYRFRPNGNDPETSWMDVWLLRPFRGERPPAAERQLLGIDDDFTDAPELGPYARVFHQDVFNMGEIQRGLHTLVLNKPGVTLARYQETKIRHFHEMWDRYMGPEEV